MTGRVNSPNFKPAATEFCAVVHNMGITVYSVICCIDIHLRIYPGQRPVSCIMIPMMMCG